MGKNKKKEDFHLPILSASLWYLSSLLSHILISLASIHRNTFTRSANGMNTGTTPLDTKLTVASFLPPTSFFLLNVTQSFVMYFLTCPDWYVLHGATSSFNSNIRIHHIRTTWFCVAMVETINWLGGFQHKTKKPKNRRKTVQAGGRQNWTVMHVTFPPSTTDTIWVEAKNWDGRYCRQVLRQLLDVSFRDLEEFSDPELK